MTTTAADPKNPVIGADFCKVLAQAAPELKTAGNPTAALSALTLLLTSWLEIYPAQNPRTIADLDAAATASCPALRTNRSHGLPRGRQPPRSAGRLSQPNIDIHSACDRVL